MLRCIIVEDEPLAAEVIIDYIKQLPFVQLKATCSDAIAALEIVRKEAIDLIFLDIHLPGLKGLDFIRTLSNPPAIIIITAYHQYALDGYDLSVVDYLLKPIEFARFVEAVNKVNARKGGEHRKTISVQSDKKTVVIPVEDILFIESQKEYIKIQTSSSPYVTKYALSRIEDELDKAMFLRVHRSFIVSVSKIKAFSGHEIELSNKMIPIGGNYKDLVAKRLKELFG